MGTIRFVTALFAVSVTLSCTTKDQNKVNQSKPPGRQPAQALPELGRIQPKVIYGDDDRLDLYQVEDPALLQLADSTVALINKVRMVEQGDMTFIKTSQFGETYSLCEGEPFREQDTAAFCSGFLVGNDIVVTAGHCIKYSTDCYETKLVFGFSIDHDNASPDAVKSSEVYQCKEILHSATRSNGEDFAVIRLTRPVTGHKPLALRQKGQLKRGDDLVVIGHPAGLPTKVAGGASVRSLRDGYLVANLDTYGGNSGSAVFNARSGNVEGILVRGETDFVYENGCRVSKRCSDNGCRGEDVTQISEVLPYIPGLPSSL